MRVQCEVEHTTLEGDYTNRDGEAVQVPSVSATCGRCGHDTEAYGTGENSVKRCLMAMREECPRHEDNYYTGAL